MAAKHGTNKVYIYGKHALTEALEHAPQAIKKIHLSPKQDDDKLRALIKKSGIPVAPLETKQIHGIEGQATHQGVIGVLSVEDLVVPFADFIHKLEVTDSTALVLLGEVQDPHNVGAVIRSAAAFGIAGVLIPEHNQAPITGAVVKVSAGMAFRVPLVAIGNVNQTVRELKEAGFIIYGLAGEGAQSIASQKFALPSVFILGNEGAGIREKTRELCDTLIAIPMHPRCESLNAAASASVALYQWSTAHPDALKKKK
jgi:23S rRNA (guanosine2251-2'-O)-methyltransferase